MKVPANTKVTALVQDHLDIYDIKENLLILKNGGATAVIETGAINFDLLSQREQDAAIMAYSGLLNSLNYPIQVLIKSKKMNIGHYIKQIEEEEKDTNKHPLLLDAIANYKSFIQSLVKSYDILDKSFYVAINYNENFVLPNSKPLDWIKDLFGIAHKPKQNIDVDEIVEKAKSQLNPRTEHLLNEFSRINIKARRLTTEELIKLFYESYNQDSVLGGKVVTGNIKEYTTPIVELLS